VSVSESPAEDLTEPAGEAWEDPDCVRRTVVLPAGLAKDLAGQAARRGLSVSDLIAEYAEAGLRRDGARRDQPAGD
jgi:hypothetical protein